MTRGLAICLAALALAPAGLAGEPAMLVGAAEDAVKQPTVTAAKAKLDLARLAGLNAVRVTSTWSRGATAPSATELLQLRNVAAAAALDDMTIIVAVYPTGSSQTPLSDTDRADFAGYAAALAQAVPELTQIVVGNEPNLNRFWLPQFNDDGSDAAAAAYEALLAQTYDALKAVSPSIRVIGGAVSPRGVDKPRTGRDTHSPTTFIPDLGAAYRASGRTAPIMDAFAFHPYPENSIIPPSFAHPSSTSVGLADYGKLVALLGKAFDGTAQPGSTLPIYYAAFGVESVIPPEKASLYTGKEPVTIKPVDEKTQGDYYAQAIALAFCQPTVRAMFLFHVLDEPALDRLQSGFYYADGTPKASLATVSAAATQARAGTLARCQGLQLTPRASVLYPRGAALAAPQLALTLQCNIECFYSALLQRLPARTVVVTVSGRASARTATPIAFPPRTLAPGRYRFLVRLTAPVNPGPAAVIVTPRFTMPPKVAG